MKKHLKKPQSNPQTALNNSTNSIKHYRKRLIPSRPGTSSIQPNKRIQTLQHFTQQSNQLSCQYLHQKKLQLGSIMEGSFKIRQMRTKLRVDPSQLDEILRKTSLKIELGVVKEKQEIEEELLRLLQQLERKQLCNFKLNQTQSKITTLIENRMKKLMKMIH